MFDKPTKLFAAGYEVDFYMADFSSKFLSNVRFLSGFDA